MIIVGTFCENHTYVSPERHSLIFNTQPPLYWPIRSFPMHRCIVEQKQHHLHWKFPAQESSRRTRHTVTSGALWSVTNTIRGTAALLHKHQAVIIVKTRNLYATDAPITRSSRAIIASFLPDLFRSESCVKYVAVSSTSLRLVAFNQVGWHPRRTQWWVDFDRLAFDRFILTQRIFLSKSASLH